VEDEQKAPPPRHIVLEKLPEQPAKPPNVIIEKWLPYKPRTRRVVYETPPALQPHNLETKGEMPCITVKRLWFDIDVAWRGVPPVCGKCGIPDLNSSKLITTMSSPPRGAQPTVVLEGDKQAFSLLKIFCFI
jgi:hypothetical protein